MTRSATLRVLLAVSVLLNLFFVAFLGGRLLRGRLVADPSPIAWVMSSADRALDPRDAAAFGRVLHAEAPRFADAAAELSRTRSALADQVAAEPFDAAATRSALTAWRADWDRFNEAFSGPLVDALQAISPDGRRRLVAQREREGPSLQVR